MVDMQKELEELKLVCEQLGLEFQNKLTELAGLLISFSAELEALKGRLESG